MTSMNLSQHLSSLSFLLICPSLKKCFHVKNKMIITTIFSALCLPLYYFISIQAATNTSRVEVLHQFANGTRAENLCVLGNGSLLVTLLTEPSVYLVHTTSTSANTIFVQSIPSHTSLLGITHVSPDTVAIIAGNISVATLEAVSGSFAIYLLALSEESHAYIRTSFAIPDAEFLSGMAMAPASQHLLLMADSTLGVVWRLDINTSAVEKAISDPLFGKALGNPSPALNGIRVRGEYLYFSNSNTGVLGRLLITPSGERAAGAQAGILAKVANGSTFDDFEVARNGTVFISVPTGFQVLRVGPDREEVVFVKDVRIDHPSSVQSGKDNPELVLYVTTDGALEGFGGEGGGQVIRISSDINWDDSS